MTYPPLPEPTVIDGRRLYTAGDMRQYGQTCADAERARIESAAYTGCGSDTATCGDKQAVEKTIWNFWEG